MTASTTTSNFQIALIQMCSGRNVEKNVQTATAMITQAAANGAEYIQTPEVTTVMDLDRDAVARASQPQHANSALTAFQDLADKLNVWLHIGSMAILLDNADPATTDEPCFANRSFLIGPNGAIKAWYDKIHMFDVAVTDDETYTESQNYRPGTKAVVANTPWGGLGLTICYDIRFPHLFRALAHAGASFIAIPAAFTRPTGEAHWHTLVRARAIETQCFVFAAAQGGRHEHDRETYGHSLIVSPWGEVLADGGTDPGIITAHINLHDLNDVRARVPSLTHDRSFEVSKTTKSLEPRGPTQ